MISKQQIIKIIPKCFSLIIVSMLSANKDKEYWIGTLIAKTDYTDFYQVDGIDISDIVYSSLSHVEQEARILKLLTEEEYLSVKIYGYVQLQEY